MNGDRERVSCPHGCGGEFTPGRGMSRHVNAQHLAAAINRGHPAVNALSRVRSWAFGLLRGEQTFAREWIDRERDCKVSSDGDRELEVWVAARLLELCEPEAA